MGIGKILITGSNGLLGQKIVAHLLSMQYNNFVATARGENRIKTDQPFAYKAMDITDVHQVYDVIAEELPTTIIHTAAMTHVDQCEDQKEVCYAQNVTAVETLVNICKTFNIHLVHVSTDFIFDGADGPYDETATANPLSYYGFTKYEAEKIILNAAIPAAILRTVLVYGVAQDLSRSNIVLWAKAALEKKQPMQVVDDQYRTPTLAEDLAQGCVLAAFKQAKGIYNISGPDLMNIRTLVSRVAQYFNLPQDFVSTVSTATLNQKANRPLKSGLLINKAITELGYQPHTFEEGIQIVMQQSHIDA